MRALRSSDLLTLSERGFGTGVTRGALRLLETACADRSLEQLAGLPIGERDRRLLELRRRSLGGSLLARETCPACERELEVALTAADLLFEEPNPAVRELKLDTRRIRFRLPTSIDLIELQRRPDEPDPARWLGRRCVVEVEHDGEGVGTDRLDDGDIDCVGQAIAEADPQADLLLDLRCEDCGHRWESPFDIASFFLAELQARVGRVLREIHTLASAYGWSEADILAMSPWRRRAYLTLLAR